MLKRFIGIALGDLATLGSLRSLRLRRTHYVRLASLAYAYKKEIIS